MFSVMPAQKVSTVSMPRMLQPLGHWYWIVLSSPNRNTLRIDGGEGGVPPSPLDSGTLVVVGAEAETCVSMTRTSGSMTVDGDVKVPLTQQEQAENATIKAAGNKKLFRDLGPRLEQRIQAGDIEGGRKLFERGRDRASRRTSKLLQDLRAPQIASAKAKAKAELRDMLVPKP